jgi:hypothetical protein
VTYSYGIKSTLVDASLHQSCEIKNGEIRIKFQVPFRYKNDERYIDKAIFTWVANSVEEQLNEVKDLLWNERIYLNLKRGV